MPQFHFTPDEYLDLMHAEVPAYERVQDEVAATCADVTADAILDLGIGTGETARRVLAHRPDAYLIGVDASEEMLAAAGDALSDRAVDLRCARLEAPLPEGPFDLVISAFAIHHLDGRGKADLFWRLAESMRPGGRFVLADVVVPADPADAVTPIDEGFDLPDSVPDQLRWLEDAGFAARPVWEQGDLAVLRADVRDSAA